MSRKRAKADGIPEQTSPNPSPGAPASTSSTPPPPTFGRQMETTPLRSDSRQLQKSERIAAKEAATFVRETGESESEAQSQSRPSFWRRLVSAFVPGLYPAESSTATPVREDIGVGVGWGAFGMGIDPDDHLYRRITQAQRELPPIIQERALRLSWSLYESNPLAHGIIEMEKDYVVGKGFSIHATDEDVQKVLDRHWEDSVNSWDIKQHDKVRDLCMYGEGLYLAFVNEATGHVRLASVDPIWIRAIYTDPDNPEIVQTIVINPRRKVGGLSDNDKFYRVIHEDEDPASDSFGFLIGAKPGETFTAVGGPGKTYPYAGSCFFFAINRVTGAIRGRSDLLSVIDWLDAYDQILFNFVDRTLLMNSFVWDVQVTDATRQQLIDWRREHAQTPRSGTVNVHNQNESWTAVSPNFGRAEFEVQQRTLKAQILAAVGMPPHWFGEQEANRATAIEQNSPALKRLESRQLYVQYMIKMILQFQIDSSILAGELKRPPKDAPYAFEVSAPRMGSKDLSQASTSMLAVTQALTIALSAGLVDLTEARRIFVELAAELGADISFEEMIDRLGDGDGAFYIDSNQPLEPNTVPGGGVQGGASAGQADPAAKPRAPVVGSPNGKGGTSSRSARAANHAISEAGPYNPYRPRSIVEAIAVLRNLGFGISVPVVAPEEKFAVDVEKAKTKVRTADDDDE